jgi:O-antigen/teichoic acid export membrane protein
MMALHRPTADAGRRNERGEVWRRFRSRPLFGAATALGARFIQMGTTLILVPILLNHLGPAQFAVWLAASSLMGAYSFIDLGIGSYLVNHISASREASATARIYISNAFLALTLFSAVSTILVCLAFFSSKANPSVLNFQESGTWEAFFLTCVALCAVAPLSLIWKIRLSLGETAIQSVWDAFASLALFCAILIGLWFNAGLIAAVASFCVVPLVVHFLNSIQLFRKYSDLRPSLTLTSARQVVAILKSGAPFLLVNAISSISFSFDSVLALHLLPTEQAAQFGIAQRVALAVQTLLTLAVTPFWPHFRVATAGYKARNASGILLSALALALLISLSVSIALVFFGDDLIRFWTRAAISLPHHLIISLAIWIPAFAVGAVLTSLLSIPSLLPVQMKLASLSGVCCFIAKIALAKIWGGPGLFWGNCFGLCVFLIVPGFFVLVRTLRRINGAKEAIHL